MMGLYYIAALQVTLTPIWARAKGVALVRHVRKH